MRIVLVTERMALRELTMADVDNLVELDSDPEVMRFLTGGRPTERDRIEREILPGILDRYRRFPGYGYWAAQNRDTEEFLGWFVLRAIDETDLGVAELGYRLRRVTWGRGLATEGSRALVRYGFTDLGLRRVIARTMTVNQGSRRVMEKAGLRYVRTFFQDWPDVIDGSDQGDVEYAVDLVDYSSSSVNSVN